MRVIQTSIPGVVVIEPRVFTDHRGFFLESYHQQRYQDAGLAASFVQDNHSRSLKGTLRGLHYQLDHPQGKLVRVIQGEVFDVAVDIRRGSPWFGQWVGEYLSAENKKQFYVPPGFAHGFCVLSDSADVVYKCTDFYNPQDEHGLVWNDPDLGIDWPCQQPSLSTKDEESPTLQSLQAMKTQLPVYTDGKES